MQVDLSTARFIVQGSAPGVHVLYFASGLVLEYNATAGEVVSARRFPDDVSQELAETARRDREVAERLEQLDSRVL